MNKANIMVDLSCYRCGKHTQKSLKYVERRERAGKAEFHCSRKCANETHADRMKGESNPNFDGKWHGACPSTWSAEKRRAATEKANKTRIERGSQRAERNGRWAGGSQTHNCVMCGKESEYRPHVHRAIVSGEREPTCSIECAAALGRRSLKTEETSIERAMADELTAREIEFIPQYNLADKFRLDFLLPDYGIVIECDGDYWHRLPEVMRRDKRKNAYVKACGYSLYRFWEREINTDVAACVDVVMAEINAKEII